MNRRQKRLIVEASLVVSLTALAVVAMVNLKDWINRREALLAMKQLSEKIQAYKQTYGTVPPEQTVLLWTDSVSGRARLGKLTCRNDPVTVEVDPNAILAYTQQRYRSLLVHDGYIVVRVNGSVAWMTPPEFQTALGPASSAVP